MVRSISLAVLFCSAVAHMTSPELAAAEGDSPPLGPKLKIYGSLKLDTAYDSRHANLGNFVRWVELEGGRSDDDAFSMTANQTRVGLEVEERTLGGGRIDARVEVDFYGGGAENKPNPMLRHAFFRVTWPEANVELLAGQTSDLFSPLNPSTVNYSVAWWAGNIGYRRPQIRLTKTLAAQDRVVQLAVAVTRSIGDTDSDFTLVDCGADSGLPGVQARVGWKRHPAGGRRTALGVSGHWAVEERDLSATGEADHFDSYSINLDALHALTPRAVLRGELFMGQNLAPYLGGIGQGINLELGREISSRGGWISLDLEPTDDFELHVGASVEDVDEAELSAGGRSFNRSLFAGGYYTVLASARVGLEISYWTTDYLAGDTANDLRAQLALVYGF